MTAAVIAVDDIIKLDPAVRNGIIAIMSITTIPFIPLLPIVGKYILIGSGHIKNATIGAWIGGSVDTTGAVTASASLSNIETFHTAVIVKMIQNIWIIPIVICVSIYHTKSVVPSKLWASFPKFVLGFTAVACFTTIIPDILRTSVINNSFIISEWFASLSFVLIGYELRSCFKKSINPRMLIAYIICQILDTATTLGMAIIAFEIIP